MASSKSKEVMRHIPEGSKPVEYMEWLMDTGFEQDPDYPAILARMAVYRW